jgi:hypothetical protein
VENRLLKKTEDSKIKTAKRIQNVKDAAKGQNKQTSFQCFYEAIFTNISHFNK